MTRRLPTRKLPRVPPSQARRLKAIRWSVEQSDNTGVHAPISPTDPRGVEAVRVQTASRAHFDPKE